MPKGRRRAQLWSSLPHAAPNRAACQEATWAPRSPAWQLGLEVRWEVGRGLSCVMGLPVGLLLGGSTAGEGGPSHVGSLRGWHPRPSAGAAPHQLGVPPEWVCFPRPPALRPVHRQHQHGEYMFPLPPPSWATRAHQGLRDHPLPPLKRQQTENCEISKQHPRRKRLPRQTTCFRSERTALK